MAAARLLLRLAGRLESVNFTQSVCGLLGAGQGHALQLGARTACPFQPFIPRRLGETSNPGGHMELDEEDLECGLRELQEECGLQLPLAQVSCVLLGLWEESQQQLQARIQINPNEVSAFLWLGPDVATVVAATEDGIETPRLLQILPPSLCATKLKDDGGTQPLFLPMSTLLRTTPTTAEDKERVKVTFTWSPDQQRKDWCLRDGGSKGFCCKNLRPEFNA